MISVIIPTYNRLPFLQKAIESVKKQTYKDIELIVVDDGSTDGTASWLKDENINHISIPHSGMPGLVRNIGVRACKGEFIAFLDSDDLWDRAKLSLQMEYLINNPLIPLCHTREIWNRLGKTVSQAGQHHKREGYIFSDALKKCIIGPSTVLMKKKLFLEVGLFAEDLEIAEDYELWLRITAKYPVGYIDNPLIIKNGGHNDQLSSKYGHIEYFRILALEKNINTFPQVHKQEALEVLIKKMEIYKQGSLKRNKIDEVLKIEENVKKYKNLLNSILSKPGIII